VWFELCGGAADGDDQRARDRIEVNLTICVAAGAIIPISMVEFSPLLTGAMAGIDSGIEAVSNLLRAREVNDFGEPKCEGLSIEAISSVTGFNG
jgi:hypothetical protein